MFLLRRPAEDGNIVDVGSPAAVIVGFEQLINVIGGTRLATNRSCLNKPKKMTKTVV